MEAGGSMRRPNQAPVSRPVGSRRLYAQCRAMLGAMSAVAPPQSTHRGRQQADAAPAHDIHVTGDPPAPSVHPPPPSPATARRAQAPPSRGKPAAVARQPSTDGPDGPARLSQQSHNHLPSQSSHRQADSTHAAAAAEPAAAAAAAAATAAALSHTAVPPARSTVPSARPTSVPPDATPAPRHRARTLFPTSPLEASLTHATSALDRAAAALAALQPPPQPLQPSAQGRPSAPTAAVAPALLRPTAAGPQALQQPPPRAGEATLHQRPSFNDAKAALTQRMKPLPKPPLFSDVDQFVDRYATVPMTVTGDKAPQPVLSFNRLAETPFRWPPNMLKNMARGKLNKPTPIQSHAIPAMLAGRDVLVCAQSGSGKTVAFLAPIIAQLLRGERLSTKNIAYPSALVLTPTRELAAQLYSVARSLVEKTHLRILCITGGEFMAKQIMFLRGGCDIMIATPGRLIEIMDKRKRIRFSQLQFLVVDEADRMLDLGFETELQRIARHKSMVPCGQRQTAFFSATFPSSLQQVAREYLHNPLTIRMGLEGGSSELITQRVIAMPPTMTHRLNALEGHVAEVPGLCIVFCSSGPRAAAVHAHLTARGTAASLIHSGLHQELREEAMRCFEFGVTQVLVATDIVSRGLHVVDVAHVVQFDMPAEIEEYVNRIGRTGRAGQLGTSTSYFTVHDTPLSAPLQQVLLNSSQPVPEWLATMALQFTERPLLGASRSAAGGMPLPVGGGQASPGRHGGGAPVAGPRAGGGRTNSNGDSQRQAASSSSSRRPQRSSRTDGDVVSVGRSEDFEDEGDVRQLPNPWTKGHNPRVSSSGSYQPSDEPLLAVLREQRGSSSSSAAATGGSSRSGSSNTGGGAALRVAPAASRGAVATMARGVPDAGGGVVTASQPYVWRGVDEAEREPSAMLQPYMWRGVDEAERRPSAMFQGAVQSNDYLAALWEGIVDSNGAGAEVDRIIESARAATAETLLQVKANRAAAVAMLADVRKQSYQQTPAIGQATYDAPSRQNGGTANRTADATAGRNGGRTVSAPGRQQGAGASGGTGPASRRRYDDLSAAEEQQATLQAAYAQLNLANNLALRISRIGHDSRSTASATPAGSGGGGGRSTKGVGNNGGAGAAARGEAAVRVNIQDVALRMNGSSSGSNSGNSSSGSSSALGGPLVGGAESVVVHESTRADGDSAEARETREPGDAVDRDWRRGG